MSALPARARSASRERRLDQSPRRSRSSYWRTCSHAYSRGNGRLCAAGETGGRLQSEKFSVNLHRFLLQFSSRHFRTVQPRLAFVPTHQTSQKKTLLVPSSSHPSFLLTYFSIPISLPYLGLGQAGKRSHRAPQNSN